MMSLFFYMSMLLVLIIIIAITPYITRKTEQFGVTIPQSIYERNDLVKLRKTYALYTMMLGILMILIQLSMYVFFNDTVQHIGFIINTFLFLFLSFFIYFIFHKKMKQLKQTEKWTERKKQRTVISTSFHQEKNVISNWAYLLPLLVVIGTIIYTFFMYDKIPHELPMHTSMNGEVRYDEKTVFNVLLIPATQLFMIGLFLIINIVIGKSKQEIHASNPDVSKLQNKLYRLRWSRFLFISGLLMVVMFLFIQLTFIHPTLQSYETPVIIAVIAFLLVGSILLSIRTGQGGSRIKVDHDSFNDELMDRDQDEYWKLGQFYFNKNDPSIFIEKRFGVGWTNNWAHPISWILLVSILIVAIAIPLLLTYF